MRPTSSPAFATIAARLSWAALAGVVYLTPVASPARGYEPLPAAASHEYALDAGDEIRVTVSELPTVSGSYVIGDDGLIALPMVGSLAARGKSTRQLQEAIAENLRGQQILLKPTVNVQLARGKPVYVLGEVKKPGEYTYRPGMNVLTAIATAGGFTFRARQNSFLVTRAIDGRLVTGTVTSERQVLPGDTINVRESWF